MGPVRHGHRRSVHGTVARTTGQVPLESDRLEFRDGDPPASGLLLLDRQGYPSRVGLRTDPWNLIRFKPAKGARFSRLPPVPCEPGVTHVRGSRTLRSSPMSDFAAAYPNSRKVHVDGPRDVKVPMREIALSGGEPP